MAADDNDAFVQSSDLESGMHEHEKVFGADFRKAFIRKVYGILSIQLALTVLVSVICMYSVGVQNFVVAHALAIQLVSLIPMFGFLIALFFFKNRHPLNLILLFGFTFFMSWTVGTVCAIYQKNGAGDVVLSAFVMTLVLFLSLTAFTFQSKIDFSFMGAGLMGCLWLLLLWGLVNAIFGWRTSFLYALFGAIVFSLFIIYDTSRLIRKFDIDDYVLAAIDLYLDVINLFLYLLQLLSRKD